MGEMTRGERVEVESLDGTKGIATVVVVSEVEDKNSWLVDFRFDDAEVPYTSTYLVPKDRYNPHAEDRRSNSLMPVEYRSKFGKDFDWGKYGDPCITQKGAVNNFINHYKEYAKQGRGLYIYSKTKGSGKTLLSCCIANELLRMHDMSVRFISIVDYIELVKSKAPESKEVLDKILNCSLLIADDIGVNNDKQDWINNAIFRLVDRRYTNHLPTIFTSNIEIDKLKTDERAVERIYEVSTPVKMPEVNVRRKIADKNNREFVESLLVKAQRGES